MLPVAGPAAAFGFSGATVMGLRPATAGRCWPGRAACLEIKIMDPGEAGQEVMEDQPSICGECAKICKKIFNIVCKNKYMQKMKNRCAKFAKNCKNMKFWEGLHFACICKIFAGDFADSDDQLSYHQVDDTTNTNLKFQHRSFSTD